jgi:hypothetical protein
MKTAANILFTSLAFSLAAWAQEIPNPGFEEPVIDSSVPHLTPGSAGFGEAQAMLQWSFGAQAGICAEGRGYAEGLTAAEGRQMAFIQGQSEENEQSRPRNIFGVDVTGLQPGEEYEISWQQTGRRTDVGTTAVSVVLGDGQKPPLHVMTKEPVGTKGEWESKSVWFLATAPTMRLNIRHFILEAGNSNVGSETTLFDDFKIRAGRSAP